MEHQKYVVTQIDTLLELLEHAPEAEANAVMLMQEMDRLCHLLGMLFVGYDGQAAFGKKEEVH